MPAFLPPYRPPFAPFQQHSRGPRFSALAVFDQPQNLFINRIDHAPFLNPAEANHERNVRIRHASADSYPDSAD